jgi:hypothetical protein
LADILSVPSTLQRKPAHLASTENLLEDCNHYWNTIELNGKKFIVDLMHNPSHIYEDTVENAFSHSYKGLNQASSIDLKSYEPTGLASPKSSKVDNNMRWMSLTDLGCAKLDKKEQLGKGVCE